MARQSLAEIACSIARTADLIGERWTLLVLRDLFAGLSRFEDVRRDLGIASNVLSDRLNTLERGGLIERRRYQTNPPRDEYVLTEKGRDLYPVITTIVAWGDKWLAGAEGPPALIMHSACGHPATAVTVCDNCSQPLNAENTYAAPGPGGRQGPGTALIAAHFAETPAIDLTRSNTT